MDYNQGLDLGRQALLMTLLISGPVMGVGLFVGLVVSLLQSVTQLQEQTISFVPKIIAMVAVGVLLAPWLVDQLLEYARELLGECPF